MKYFLHDCNALNDEKISELLLAHGYEGLGLFYSVLEKIGAQEKPVKTIVLKHQLKVGKKLEKCWSFMEEIGLISCAENYTWAKFFDKSYNTNRISYRSPSKWKVIVTRIFLRDNYICQYCGSNENIECDHVMPFSKGGGETDDNLITACRSCNRRKKDKPVSEFIQLLNSQKN